MVKKLTTDDFITKARAKHGDKYDYSKVEYIGNKIKIKIICPKHGEFEQTPIYHIKSVGCKYCGINNRNKNKKLTTIDFIAKARLKHGDKYNYSPTKYTNGKTKVKIKCKVHGIFEQNASNHLCSSGCPKCATNNIKQSLKNTINEFIIKANVKHCNKYDYSDSVYINNKTKIKIKCNIHGIFEQQPSNHLMGKGCPKCADKVRANKLSKKDKFIERAQKRHFNKYNYSKVKYTGCKNKIDIICPCHGTFKQEANSHLRGTGCPQCGFLLGRIKKRLVREKWEHNAKKKHNDKFCYNKTIYISKKRKVLIKCKKHGYFRQRLHGHLNGKNGCLQCSTNGLKLNKNEFIRRAKKKININFMIIV